MTESPSCPPPPTDCVRILIRSCDRAALATLMAGAKETTPSASLVLTACDYAAAPLLLLSNLAEHTVNLRTNPRCALLFDGTAGLNNPLIGARVTVRGRMEIVEDRALLARYLARHPSATLYADFSDFHLFRMAVEEAHLVAGFGHIHTLSGKEVLFEGAGTNSLADVEQDLLKRLNMEHSAAIAHCANRVLGLAEAGWRLTGIDPEGADLRLEEQIARLNFPEPVSDKRTAQALFLELAKSA